MRRLFVILLCCASSSLVAAAPAPVKAPEHLLAQVQRLSELLRDRYAVWYPDATMVQLVNVGEGEELALAVFTVESFGGGNNHTQFFAVFNAQSDEKGKQHFALVDVIPIAGKGWRGVMNLNAAVSRDPKSKESHIAFDALEVAGDDAANFPSKKVTVNLLLKGGRLVEQK